ncbi:hypothetical protein EDB19DRAFT_1776217 [Suillus lakei]|nr:hypothetical protein EDB19DRAFT_1815791 [Suillus lakei]KAG1720591.1 hypothetical protein EDB19DRAFT_1776217 [Suillus lakei]
MLVYAPSDGGCRNVVNNINKCADEASPPCSIYIRSFCLFVQGCQRSDPESSFHTSRPPFNTVKAGIAHVMKESHMDQRTAKARVLVRDNFRCVVTGNVDSTAYHTCRDSTCGGLLVANKLCLRHKGCLYVSTLYQQRHVW